MSTNNIDAYLDIETTGLSRFEDDITVAGIYLCNGQDDKLVQLVGRDITVDSLTSALQGVNTIYTYNGSRFDVPFIHTRLGLDLRLMHHHHDLMYDCWRHNLKGGFKAVEYQLSIPRKLRGIEGFMAVVLWWRYYKRGDRNALKLLLQYNEEDVVNLKVLKEKLHIPLCSVA